MIRWIIMVLSIFWCSSLGQVDHSWSDFDHRMVINGDQWAQTLPMKNVVVEFDEYLWFIDGHTDSRLD